MNGSSPQYSKALSAVTLIVVIAVVILTSTKMIVGDYYGWRAFNASSEVEEWEHLTSAIRHEPTNVSYRLIRGEVAWKYLEQESSGTSVNIDFTRSGVKDWEFLYSQVENNVLTYEYLNEFYFFAGTPTEERLAPPEGFNPNQTIPIKYIGSNETRCMFNVGPFIRPANERLLCYAVGI